MSRKLRSSLAVAAFAFAAMAGASTSGHASEYWSNTYWYVGDFTDNDGPSCILSTEDAGTDGRASLYTNLALAKGTTYLSVQNADWTITVGEEYPDLEATFFDPGGDVTASYGGASWIGGRSNMLMTKVDEDILEHFAKDQKMTVFRGTDEDLIIVGRVNLNGSSQAVSKLRECYQRASARYDAQVQRERTQPKNPFAR